MSDSSRTREIDTVAKIALRDDASTAPGGHGSMATRATDVVVNKQSHARKRGGWDTAPEYGGPPAERGLVLAAIGAAVGLAALWIWLMRS